MDDQKADTRKRIVRSAARLFRRYGYQGVGIDEIMAAAGLTRGGFYAHFRSKEDLFRAAVADELELTARMRAHRQSARSGAASGARALVEFYLGDGDRAHVAASCPLVSLSPDVARSSEDARAAYTATLQQMLTELAQCIAGDGAGARARALAALALCVGGVVMARAVSDEQLAAELVEVCRARAFAEVGY
jgi:AcrR family transcriptional regulator